MNLRIITKNHTADQEKGFLAKSVSKSNGYATAMPTAWELSSGASGLKNPGFENLVENFRPRLSTSQAFDG